MKRILLASCALLAMAPALAVADVPPPGAPPLLTARHEVFYVGGQYEGDHGKQVMVGQMFVEVISPQQVTHPFPVVLIHGLAQTAVNWMETPDGREGWADWFAAHGWRVYMVDQPARGRSAWNPDLQAPVSAVSVAQIENLFTDPQAHPVWDQAKLHTQWPGAGRAGDSVFDQFYASQVQSLPNEPSETLMRQAGAALLDRIGPAIILTHSQAGAFGWLIADARPKLVRAIVALEPMGPPYKDAVFLTGHDRPWGLTHVPLTYDPPVTDASALSFVQQPKPDAPDLAACWSQATPARSLPNLRGIPVLIATTQASYHAVYDHCTAEYLRQAGVDVDFERLADHGIGGNGHMMMLEKNNLQISAFLAAWIEQHVH